MGFLAGDWAWGARKGGLSDEQLDSLPYLAGSIVSGFFALGHLRDMGANLGSREWRAALASLREVIPVLGDATKVLGSAVAFAKWGGRATRAAMHLFVFTPRIEDAQLADGIRKIVQVDPANARLSSDAAVWGEPAQAALFTQRPISTSDTQNTRKDEIVSDLQSQGYTDIRVNQQQVNAAGQLVGINRPDIQATAPGRTRHYFVLDTASSGRGPSHMVRILSNDDSGNVHLVEQIWVLRTSDPTASR